MCPAFFVSIFHAERFEGENLCCFANPRQNLAEVEALCALE